MALDAQTQIEVTTLIRKSLDSSVREVIESELEKTGIKNIDDSKISERLDRKSVV